MKKVSGIQYFLCFALVLDTVGAVIFWGSGLKSGTLFLCVLPGLLVLMPLYGLVAFGGFSLASNWLFFLIFAFFLVSLVFLLVKNMSINWFFFWLLCWMIFGGFVMENVVLMI